VHRVGNAYIEQSGTFYKITPFQSINSFADSRIWRLCNFKFKYFGKIDYKSCFNSIYTHTYKWIIEKNIVDSKDANCSNLYITIDRILMNINGLTSNGIVIGPEFSRMIAEILLQQIDMEVYYALKSSGLHHKNDYMVFRYVDDIFIFANSEERIEFIIDQFSKISNKYLLSLNELKIHKEKTPCLPKEWLEKTREMSDRISNIFNSEAKIDSNEYTIVGNDYIPVDRLKDQVILLIKENPEYQRTIVSYLLSVLLNNIGKKTNGYNLFNSNNRGKSLLIIDLTMFIYSFCPSFEQTRKVISIISYINKEIDFKGNDEQRNKLNKVFYRYNFLYRTANINDICDWFPFFLEFGISLDTKTEEIIVNKTIESDNPIILGTILLYSQYNVRFRTNLCSQIEEIINERIDCIKGKDKMLYKEFWYVIVFHNCPFISSDTNIKIQNKIDEIAADYPGNKPSEIATSLVIDFLKQKSGNGCKPKNSFFNWNGQCDFVDKISYCTYQRTKFRQYKKNKNWLYASI